MNRLAVLQNVAGYVPRKGSIPYLLRFQECDWAAVIARSKTHPHEVRINERGNDVFGDPLNRCSVLHDMLSHHRPPVEAVEALVDAERGLLYHKYWIGEDSDDEEDDDFVTPLRLACAVRDPPHPAEVLELLLKKTVEPVGTCAKVKVPINFNPLSFMNSDECTPEQVNLFLNIFPQGAVGCFRKETGCPLDNLISNSDDTSDFRLVEDDFLWRKFQHFLVASDRVCKANFCTPLHSFLRRFNVGFNAFWEIDHEDLDNPEKLLLNAVPALKRFAKESPSYFNTKDDRGRLPLHLLLEEEMPCYLPRDIVAKLLDITLATNPQAAQTCNREGRLPLHLALENLWPWQAIHKAAPQAMETRDLVTHFFPILTAVYSDSLTDIYGVLRENPSVLSYFLRGIMEQDIATATERIKQLKRYLHELELEVAWKRRRLESYS